MFRDITEVSLRVPFSTHPLIEGSRVCLHAEKNWRLKFLQKFFANCKKSSIKPSSGDLERALLLVTVINKHSKVFFSVWLVSASDFGYVGFITAKSIVYLPSSSRKV